MSENIIKAIGFEARCIDLEAENAALRAKLEKAITELDDTIEELDDFNSYASEYFQKKHHHTERIEAHRATLAEIKEES